MPVILGFYFRPTYFDRLQPIVHSLRLSFRQSYLVDSLTHNREVYRENDE